MRINNTFGLNINKDLVLRVLAKYYTSSPNNKGPSWLSFIGNIKDSLWSIDFFRVESITLNSYWVMLVLDQYTRRIIGFAAYRDDLNGPAICCMFHNIINGHSPPKYLSSDNDPMLKFHRWKANLRILEIEEIKSIPYTPTSHPFVERLIGTIRREFLDHTLFWNQRDLIKKLNEFKSFYNDHRAHSSLNADTPSQKAEGSVRRIASTHHFKWKSYCNNLFQLPIAA